MKQNMAAKDGAMPEKKYIDLLYQQQAVDGINPIELLDSFTCQNIISMRRNIFAKIRN